MSVKSEYVSAVRREIDRYAVWEPGQPLELGDYGELHGKTFEKRGNIRDFKVAAKELSGAPALYEFTSAGTTIAEVKAEASLSTGAVESVPKLALEFKFSRENGLVIRAAQSHTIQVSNLQDVAAALW